MKIYGTTFYGNEISDYSKENNRLDYATLSKAFDCVLNNTIINIMPEYWEPVSYYNNDSEIEELKDKIEELESKINVLDDLEQDSAVIDMIDDLDDKIRECYDEIEELEDYTPEVFQWYIVDEPGAEILTEIGEIVFYNSELDIYLWGVTHYGTHWDYVLTDVPCNTLEVE